MLLGAFFGALSWTRTSDFLVSADCSIFLVPKEGIHDMSYFNSYYYIERLPYSYKNMLLIILLSKFRVGRVTILLKAIASLLDLPKVMFRLMSKIR